METSELGTDQAGAACRVMRAVEMGKPVGPSSTSPHSELEKGDRPPHHGNSSSWPLHSASLLECRKIFFTLAGEGKKDRSEYRHMELK